MGRAAGEAPRPGWRRGVGYAAMFHVGGGARVYRSDGCGAILKLDDFGKVSLITGASEIGQGSETVLAMIVAEELPDVVSRDALALSPDQPKAVIRLALAQIEARVEHDLRRLHHDLHIHVAGLARAQHRHAF